MVFPAQKGVQFTVQGRHFCRSCALALRDKRKQEGGPEAVPAVNPTPARVNSPPLSQPSVGGVSGVSLPVPISGAGNLSPKPFGISPSPGPKISPQGVSPTPINPNNPNFGNLKPANPLVAAHSIPNPLVAGHSTLNPLIYPTPSFNSATGGVPGTQTNLKTSAGAPLPHNPTNQPHLGNPGIHVPGHGLHPGPQNPIGHSPVSPTIQPQHPPNFGLAIPPSNTPGGLSSSRDHSSTPAPTFNLGLPPASGTPGNTGQTGRDRVQSMVLPSVAAIPGIHATHVPHTPVTHIPQLNPIQLTTQAPAPGPDTAKKAPSLNLNLPTNRPPSSSISNKLPPLDSLGTPLFFIFIAFLTSVSNRTTS